MPGGLCRPCPALSQPLDRLITLEAMDMNHDPIAPSRRALLTGAGALGTLLLLAPRLALSAERFVRMRTKVAEDLLNKAVAGADWWDGASTSTYSDQQYDTIRLKRLADGGYLTYISGEGNEDFSHEEVVKTVWKHQDKLDLKMSGCVAAERVGKGADPVVGTQYIDLYMLLDFGIFYGEFFQRMYKYPQPDGRTLMAFEKLRADMVDSATWARYQEARRATLARHDEDMRSLFGRIIEVSQTFGVFIAEKGTRQASRISMVAKIGFGEGTGMAAQLGSKMPAVIKAGLRAGFDASVAIATGVKRGRYQ